MKERVGTISAVFHLACFVLNCVGVYYDLYYTYLSAYSAFCGRARFLTRHVEFFSLFYTGFAFFADLHYLFICGKNKKPLLIQWRDFLFAAVVFPFCSLVVLMFWGIAAVDIDGLVPLKDRKKYPLVGCFNGFLHVWPIIFAISCATLVFHKYPQKRRGLMGTIGTGLGYFLWILFLARVDTWPYGFMGKLSVLGFIFFVALCVLILMLLYLCGERLTNFAWKHLKEKEI